MFRTDKNLVDLTPSVGAKVPIDSFDSQDFNLNEAGWVRNDISQLARAQSLQEYNLIMSRLQVLQDSKSLPENMTVEQAFKTIKPRFCQSPNEIEQWIEFTQADVDAAIAEVIQKQNNVDSEKKQEAVADVVNESAS